MSGSAATTARGVAEGLGLNPLRAVRITGTTAAGSALTGRRTTLEGGTPVVSGRQHFNGLKTAALFGGIFGVLVLVGALLGQVLPGGSTAWIVGAFLLGLVVTGYGYWNSDKIAIRAMRARPVTEREQPAMHRIVRELAATAGQPMPRLYVSPTMAPNAFATGRNPENAAVCCTEGILRILDERELRGVLGHELMHVYNRDILTSSVAAAIAGAITSLVNIAYFASIFGGGNSENRANPLVLLFTVIAAPFAATLIQLAISRTREYDADEDGARLTGDPLALASALRKIHAGTQALPLPPERQIENSAHMFIANPFRGGGVASLFATHPPMEQRVARLQEMAGRRG
jgi:heat shock protein HtpX